MGNKELLLLAYIIANRISSLKKLPFEVVYMAALQEVKHYESSSAMADIYAVLPVP